MQILSHYVSFGHHNAVQILLLILSILLQHPTGHAFKYAEEYHELATSGYFHKEHSLIWDDLELQHLSNVNGPNLHSNGFHVINATFPHKGTSFIMHLSKTQGLFHPQQLGMSANDSEHLQCFYSGTIAETTNGIYSKSGVVSLSTCHHDFGFEGLLLLPHEQYYIRPSISNHQHHQHHHHHHHHNQNGIYSNLAKRSVDTPTTSNKPTVSHKAYKVNSPNGPYSKQPIDEVLRVPPEELLKATKNQSGSMDQLEDEEPTEVGPETGTEDEEENPILEDSLIGGDDCDDPNGCTDSIPPVMAALSKGKGKQQKRKKSQKKPPKKAASSSSKNQVVEIAVFTDESLYKVWKQRYPKSTTTKMNQYALAVINNMNALYKQPSMTENISFRLVHLDIETKKPKSLNEHNGHATKYLRAFCDYAAEKNQYGRLWDHALLLTGLDLNEGGTNTTAGIAWLAGMCLNSLSCSVIEGASFGSTFITAHEIGHSLGMDHDGTGPNTGCDANSYIMSPTTGGGKTDWSKCSIKNMKDFISKGHTIGNPAPTCMTKKGSKAGNAIKFSSDKLPGQQFDANEQCEGDCKGCTPYVKSQAPYNNMCHALYCQEKLKGIYVMIRSSHPALEGTTCGKGKVCRLGKCQ